MTSIAWFLALMAFLISLPILPQASPFILIGIAVIALVLAAPSVRIWTKISRNARGFIKGSLKTALAFLFVLGAAAAAPVLYFATIEQVAPALVPQATLSNGRRAIIFQRMQHVGGELFYKSVVYDLEDALSQRDVLYYEGVKPSSKANDTWLATNVTGGADIGNAYRSLGALCGPAVSGRLLWHVGP